MWRAARGWAKETALSCLPLWAPRGGGQEAKLTRGLCRGSPSLTPLLLPLGLEARACQHGRSLGGDVETSSPTRPHLGPVPQPRAPVLHPGDNRYSGHPQGGARIRDITGQSSSRAFPRSGRASHRLSSAAAQRRSGGSRYGVPARVVREGLWKLLATGSVLAKAPLSFSGDFARRWLSRLHSGADSCALRGPARLASVGLGGRSHVGRECQEARRLTAPNCSTGA